MLKGVAEKAAASTHDEKKVLKASALAELTPFLATRGYPALDELITQLTTTPTALITVDDLRVALTPDQKRSFIKYLLQK